MAVNICVVLFTFVKVATGNMEGHIVGGQYANIKDFAHSAFLFVSDVIADDLASSYACGSSIINQAIMLTAAHCFEDCSESAVITVFVGHEDVEEARSIPVVSYKMHENYDTVAVSNDIALFVVKNDVRFGNTVRRVALMAEPPYHLPAVVAGWGLVDDDNMIGTKKLKFAKQKVWSRASCQSLLPSTPEGTLCAGLKDGDDYAAEGDSGSALLVNGYIQVGIVSFKDPSVSRSVVVYTDVGHFYHWIKRHAKLLYCQRGKGIDKSRYNL